jgi:hypothetical protein
MATSQSVAVLRSRAIQFSLGGLLLIFVAFALGLGFASRFPGITPYLLGLVAVGATVGAIALGAALVIKRLGVSGRRPARLESADGARCFILHQDSLLIGRGPCCDIILPLKSVSTHHCHLHRVGSGWIVEDMHSLNGIAVNHRRVVRKRVRTGDVLGIADYELVFR